MFGGPPDSPPRARVVFCRRSSKGCSSDKLDFHSRIETLEKENRDLKKANKKKIKQKNR